MRSFTGLLLFILILTVSLFKFVKMNLEDEPALAQSNLRQTEQKDQMAKTEDQEKDELKKTNQAGSSLTGENSVIELISDRKKSFEKNDGRKDRKEIRKLKQWLSQ